MSEEVGRGYGNNGDVMVAQTLQPSDPAGTQQSLLGLINLDGRDDPDNPVYASMFSIPLPVETFALGYYVMVRTGDRANIAYNRASDSITIGWPQDYTYHLRERAQLVFDRVLQANGVEYRDDLFQGKVFAPNTVHPMGGVVRGRATDAYGRVKGLRQAVCQRCVVAARLSRLQPVHVHHRARRTQHRRDPAGPQVNALAIATNR